MLRSIVAAMATAAAASKAKGIARQAAYGAVAVFSLLVALVFSAIAAFYYLSQSMGPAGAAATVAAILAVLAMLVFIVSRVSARDDANGNWAKQLGLPAVAGITDTKDIEAMVDKTQIALRKAGPVKLSLAALAIGFLLARLR